MPRVNHNLPDSYGLSLTVYVPTASETTPVEQGDALTFVATASNSVAPSAAGDVVHCRAKHTVSDPMEPLGVHVYGFSRVDTFTFTGTAPAIGASVVADGAGGMMDAGVDAGGAPIANGTRVVYVDTAAGTVDVLMP